MSTNMRTCDCGQFTLPNSTLCVDCNAEMNLVDTPQDTLKVFEVDLQPDYQIDKQGFYIVLLAKDLQSAKVFAQAQFNIEYDGVIDVFNDDVTFDEIKGPFPAGKVLTSLHY